MSDLTLRRALARRPGANFADGLTTANLGKPCLEAMLRQHAAYVAALESLGLEVTVLEPLEDHPDACFIEDAAVITPEVAVVSRPGAPSRRGETVPIEPVLAQYREIRRIHPPGTLDGGDVLVVGRHAFIGISARTNRDGAAQLGRILEGFGYHWTAVPVHSGLHLKSSVSLAGPETLLLTEELAGLTIFKRCDRIVVDPSESYAANSLWVNSALLMPAGFPRTCKTLRRRGLQVIGLDTSEARKMDGGLTCMSLRF